MRYYELIETRWAVGKDHKHATVPHQNRVKYGSHDDSVLVWVNIEDVFNNMDKGFELDLNDPKGGVNAISGRISKAKAHWSDDGYMDPSELGVSDWSKKVVFTDGRHRMVAAYQMGQEYAPAYVPKEELEALRNLVKIKIDK